MGSRIGKWVIAVALGLALGACSDDATDEAAGAGSSRDDGGRGGRDAAARDLDASIAVDAAFAVDAAAGSHSDASASDASASGASGDAASPADASSPAADAAFVTVDCDDNGDCGDDDCVCSDCHDDLFCSDPANCVDDGVCLTFQEGCVCADCATHPACR